MGWGRWERTEGAGESGRAGWDLYPPEACGLLAGIVPGSLVPRQRKLRGIVSGDEGLFGNAKSNGQDKENWGLSFSAQTGVGEGEQSTRGLMTVDGEVMTIGGANGYMV